MSNFPKRVKNLDELAGLIEKFDVKMMPEGPYHMFSTNFPVCDCGGQLSWHEHAVKETLTDEERKEREAWDESMKHQADSFATRLGIDASEIQKKRAELMNQIAVCEEWLGRDMRPGEITHVVQMVAEGIMMGGEKRSLKKALEDYAKSWDMDRVREREKYLKTHPEGAAQENGKGVA